MQLKEPAQAPWVFREAFRVARSGRPGPVLIDLPLDVQRGECLYDPDLDGPLPVEVPVPRGPKRKLKITKIEIGL